MRNKKQNFVNNSKTLWLKLKQSNFNEAFIVEYTKLVISQNEFSYMSSNTGKFSTIWNNPVR